MIESPILVPSALEKAERALAHLESILRHDHSRITRQADNAFKDAARGVATGIDILKRQADASAR
jgi:hypothetical protein